MFVQVQLVTGVALDRHLSVMINAPSSLIVGRADDASGQITFNVEETGESLYMIFMRLKQNIFFNPSFYNPSLHMVMLFSVKHK